MSKEIKLKEIEFNDVYALADALKGIQIDISEEEIQRLQEGGNQIEAGIAIVQKLVTGLKSSKKDLNGFLGHMYGMTGAEFGKLGLRGTTKAIRELNAIKNSEDFADFIDAVSQLIA